MPDLRKLFNDRADSWDQSIDYNTDHIRTMLMLSDLRPGSLILDVGCGTGVLEPYLLRYQPRQIVAVDFADRMIDIAKKKIEDERVRFICKDIFAVTSENVRCDYCFFFGAFPHFPNPEQLIPHIQSLMQPGGRLTICHQQGKKSAPGGGVALPMLPAQGLINMLHRYFRLDVIIDNNVMFLVSGCSLNREVHGVSGGAELAGNR